MKLAKLEQTAEQHLEGRAEYKSASLQGQISSVTYVRTSSKG